MKFHRVSEIVLTLALLFTVSSTASARPQGRILHERGFTVQLKPYWIGQQDGTYVGNYDEPNRHLVFGVYADLPPSIKTLPQLKKYQTNKLKADGIYVIGVKDAKLNGRAISVLRVSTTFYATYRDVYGAVTSEGDQTNSALVVLFMTSKGPAGWYVEQTSEDDADLVGIFKVLLAATKLE